MIKRLFQQLFSKDFPIWFRILNLCILLPILLYPLVFFTTIFFFDNPENLGLTWLLFFAVNAYPIYLLIIAYFNSILFQKNKILGSILPTFVLLILLYGVIYVVTETRQNIAESIKRENERTKQGYIGASDDFKILDNKVYRYDTLVVGADAKTFEIFDWQWQKDKTTMYYKGKPMTDIDVNTFVDIRANYYKDKNKVYFYDQVLVGADPTTFEVDPMTHIAKDKNGCYFLGEQKDCKTILKEIEEE